MVVIRQKTFYLTEQISLQSPKESSGFPKFTNLLGARICVKQLTLRVKTLERLPETNWFKMLSVIKKNLLWQDTDGS